ncbi:ABC transporter ATP-binding protein [Virgibacillus kekensis]|uniref:ABC transporter ATP-binding protein n=1 Tax=Virgibacillus kekensis TaxID=202261 RepID=A0ABV9DHN6_9BACI
MSKLTLDGLTKKFDDNVVVDNLNLSIEEGEFVSLLGPSGCGKSTTLRMISGFIQPNQGEISIDGQNITKLPPNKRDTSLVFQNYALFPHMTIADNVGYGLKMRKVNKQEIEQRVNDMLKMVRLDHLKDRFPGQLSGGQQQRVALARALVVNPSVLLLDEPLSNLDAKLRDEMRSEILNLQLKFNLTCIFVTHDQEEALVLSDKVVVMDSGHIRQIGTPREIFDSPNSHFTADFVGVRNIFSGEQNDANFNTNFGGQFYIGESNHQVHKIGIRPNMIVVNPPEEKEYDNRFKATVETLLYRGTIIELVTTLETGEQVIVELPSEKYKVNTVSVGDVITLAWETENVIPLQG